MRDEIAEPVGKLPPWKQEQVLRLVETLDGSDLPAGDSVASLMQFAGTLDDESAREMREAIEDCEQIGT
jgi:hypothetical protein